jgi:hypothetical protein
MELKTDTPFKSYSNLKKYFDFVCLRKLLHQLACTLHMQRGVGDGRTGVGIAAISGGESRARLLLRPVALYPPSRQNTLFISELLYISLIEKSNFSLI